VDGPAVVEATSVIFERHGVPSLALLTALIPDGRRALAISRDGAAMQSMCEQPWEGTTVRIGNDGSSNHLAG
jgi:hypothetical protein